MAHTEHSFEEGGPSVFAQATYLARGSHIDAQHGVGLLQTVEGELARFNAHVFQIKDATSRFLYGQTQHDTCCHLNEVHLQHLAHEGEGARGAEIALDDLDIILACQELNVEGTRYVELFGNLL